MPKSKLILENSSLSWNSARRYRVNAVVSHNGYNWQNLTGNNSEPGVGSDWEQSSFKTDFITEQLDFEANGVDDFIDIGTTAKPKAFFDNSVIKPRDYWSQTGTVINFTYVPDAGSGYKNLTFI